MSLTINGSGGGIPSDLAQIFYGKFKGTNNTTESRAAVMDCPRGKPSLFIILCEKFDNMPNRTYANYETMFDLENVSNSWVALESIYYQNSARTVSFKYENEKLYFYGSFISSSTTLYYMLIY